MQRCENMRKFATCNIIMDNYMKKLILMMIPFLALVSCSPKQAVTPALDLTDLDTTVSPKVDFYKYATGGWQVKNPLKPEFSRYGSFDAIAETTQKQLNELFSSMVGMKAEKGSVDEKIATLYSQALDSTTRNSIGAEPLKAEIEKIKAIATKDEFIKHLAEMNLEGEGGFFGGGAEADLVNSDMQVLYLSQGGLGMGDRDYYLKDENAQLKAGYVAYLEKILTLAGVEGAKEIAEGDMKVEDFIAEASWTREQNRDMTAIYNPMSTEQLVKNRQVSLGQHIDELEWMSDATKARAREKLSAFTVKIGYPDKWKDYSTLKVDPELSYYENLRAASAWYVADNMSKLGKPTDPTEWGMTPQTVNAYYNPTTNEICFPAAILQPPFFNADADDAVNYGAIGVVIGHEMTHGFDDQGSLFDKDGNMNNWWTEEDRAAFVEKTKVLVDQFGEVEVLPGVKANGELTLGENIADHGGVSVAWTALHNALGGVEPKPIDGFTAAQRFFLGYAHVWAQNITDEERARLTKLDVHSLGDNRVNVTLRNFGYFFDAFGIKEGDPMFRPESERVHIW